MMNWLVEIDKKVFLYLNGKHSPLWDDIMFWISAKTSWIPLYLILLIIIIYRERPYKFIYTVLFVALVVLLCDQISVFIKDTVGRYRPTHDPEISHLVHIVNNRRGGQFGFVSSHAANTFGAAAFLANWFKNYKWELFLFGWAAIVSYSRIYLGFHYPFDIICGALLGILIGTQCYVYKVRTMVYIERKIEDRRNKKMAKQIPNNS